MGVLRRIKLSCDVEMRLSFRININIPREFPLLSIEAGDLKLKPMGKLSEFDKLIFKAKKEIKKRGK